MEDGVRKEFANGGSGWDLCNSRDRGDRVKSCGKKNKPK
jgi:hypothetical protein